MRENSTTPNRGPTRRAVLLLALTAAAVCGCPRPAAQLDQEPAPAHVDSGALRVLVVDDLPLAEAIQRQWKARAEGDIDVQQATAAELIAPENRRLLADVVIYPAGLLGELAERQFIAPVPDRVLDAAELDRKDVLQSERLNTVAWGKKTYAFSLGSPQLTLLYRADIFKRLELSPPRTWDEYQALAARLADRNQLGELASPAGAEWVGACEPLGPGWAGQMLLARAAAYARNPGRYSTLFDYNSMEPLIESAPFVRALGELVAAAKTNSSFPQVNTPEEARQAFLQGRCAMAVTWPTHADAATTSDLPVAASFAELPGADDFFNATEQLWQPRENEQTRRIPLLAIDGRLGSVTTESRRSRQALNFLVWLTSREISGEVAPYSRHTTMFRASQLDQPARWIDTGLESQSAPAYANVVRESQLRPVWLFSVRIPGRDEYLSALDAAVERALSGKQSPADALHEAADRWREITARRGLETQRAAYERSLGLEP